MLSCSRITIRTLLLNQLRVLKITPSNPENMSRYELLSPEGLRIDGRRWNELRRISAQMSTQSAVDGSSYIEQGNTKIICTVSGPIERGRGGAAGTGAGSGERGEANILFEINFAPFSGIERKRRGRSDKRVAEMQSVLQRTFASCILSHLFPRSDILINLHILSQDGSVLATCVNAATLALIDAGVPLTEYVVGCTAGSSSSYASNDESADPLLDMNQIEEGDLPSLTVATLGKSDKIVLLQMENKVQLKRLEGILAAAIDGCGQLREMLDNVVRKWGKEQVRKQVDASGGLKVEE